MRGSVILEAGMTSGDERVVHVERGGVGLLQPNLGEVTAVFLAAIFDGLQQDFFSFNERLEMIARSAAAFGGAPVQLRRVDAMQPQLFAAHPHAQAEIHVRRARVAVVNRSDQRAVLEQLHRRDGDGR